MAPHFSREPRRWIRHFRDLRNVRAAYPTGSSDPNSPALISPWLSDIVQPVTVLTPDFRIFPIAQPAAGANFVLTVPDDVIFRLLSIRGTFICDANAATRNLIFNGISNAGQIFFTTFQNTPQTASQARTIGISNYGGFAQTVSLHRLAAIPPDLWLRASFTFESAVENIQVGDQWSGLTAWVEAWPSI